MESASEAARNQMLDTQLLGPITTEPSKLKREAVKRRKPYEEVSVAKSSAQDYLADGWELDKELKIKTRLRRPFSHDHKLENQVWMLFYLLGYPEISSGRNFQIVIHRRGAEPFKKQIDIFAKDDENCLL